MKDTKLKYDIGEVAQSASPSGKTADELKETKRNQKKSLIKIGAMGIFLIVMIIFASIAWFAANTTTEISGMGIKSQGLRYTIESIENGNDGAFYDPFHEDIRGTDASNAVWQMTAEDNMDNFSGESKGISPGSKGQISFYVTPNADVELDFHFTITGYKAVYKDKLSEEGEKVKDNDGNVVQEFDKMEEITDESLKNSIAGHIMLFSDRSGRGTDADPYVYSGLIATNEDMERVLESQEFTLAKGKKKVTIYWVWPNTLSTLVDARNCPEKYMKVTQAPFTAVSDTNDTRKAIEENIVTYPQYYMKRVERIVDEDTKVVSYVVKDEPLVNSENDPIALSQSVIEGRYDVYGDLYDQMDNDIGMGVGYLLIRLSVTEHTDVEPEG